MPSGPSLCGPSSPLGSPCWPLDHMVLHQQSLEKDLYDAFSGHMSDQTSLVLILNTLAPLIAALAAYAPHLHPWICTLDLELSACLDYKLFCTS